MAKEWFTADELAGLPGLPKTKSGVIRKANKEGWCSQARQGRGGGREYPLSALPKTTRDHLLRLAARSVGDRLPVPEADNLPTYAEEQRRTGELTRDQRSIMSARLYVMDYIDELTGSTGKRSLAITLFCSMAAAGELSESTMAMLHTANARAGKSRSAHKATLYRWYAERDKKGTTAVAPKLPPPKAPPVWLPTLLALYQRPQKPSVAACLRDPIWPDNTPIPHLRTAQRHIHAMPVELREYGRMGRNARRAVQPFVRRTTDGLWPMDVVTVDGHLFKGYVRHPLTGRRFRPELTTYLDIATRKAVGFSAWVAESQLAIWTALREMVLNPACGVPAIHYSDNGAYRGQHHRSVLARLGTTAMFSEAYRAQARGVIERFNSSVWVPLAKQLDLYVGKEADPEAVKKALRRADTVGDNVMAWDDFINLARQALDDYNNRAHASLKNKTPNEVWATVLANEHWAPTVLEDDDLHDILPSESRKATRGEVQLPWGRYYDDALRDYHQCTVSVAFNPMDGSKVWVSDERGVLICVAKRDANAAPYVHTSKMEYARAQREAGRVERLQRKMDAAIEEGSATIEAPQGAPIDEAALARTQAAMQREERGDPLRIPYDADPSTLYRFWSGYRHLIDLKELRPHPEMMERMNVYWNSTSRKSMDTYFISFTLDALEGIESFDYPQGEAEGECEQE